MLLNKHRLGLFPLLLAFAASTEDFTCTLCPDGNPSPVPELMLPGSGLTCATIETFASSITDAETCAGVTSDTGYDAICRCFDVPGTCSFCSDGTELESSSLGQSCVDRSVYLPITPADSDECTVIQLFGNLACGCPTGPEACTLCSDGSIPDLSIELDGGRTCADLNETASFIPAASVSCSSLQIEYGYRQCGCPTMPDPPANGCGLCAGGDDPLLLDIIIPFKTSSTGQFETCEDLSYAVLPFQDSFEACILDQAKAYFYCGCDSLPPVPDTSFCELCSNGLSPGNPDLTVNEYGITCQQLHEYSPFILSEPVCNQVKRSADYCGCTPPVCDVCLDGLDPTISGKLVTFEGEQITCEELTRRGSENGIPADSCRTAQAIGFTECGCTLSTMEFSDCFFCGSETELPDFDLAQLGQEACLDLYALAADQMPSDCTRVQGTVGAYCGCENPVDSPEICRLCDGFLVDPAIEVSTGSIVLPGEDLLSCATIEFMSNTPLATCSTFRDAFSDACCGAPSEAPSQPPVGAPPPEAAEPSSSNVRGGLTFSLLLSSLILHFWLW